MKARYKNCILLLSTISTFLIMPLNMALESGVCCYDDASFAVIAKDLANGMGYALTLNYSGPDFSANMFNPGLGQGPVGILPVALAIKVFGVSPIMPGLTQVVLEFVLLFLVAFSLISLYKTNRIPIFFISSLLLITLISGLHYEHWYAMLGESIAALLILCGYLVWAKHGQSQRSGFEAGLCFGLAILTKEISVTSR